MSRKKFSEAMTEVNDKYYEEAAQYERKQKKYAWTKWAVMAACLCLIVGVAVLFKPGTPNSPVGDNMIVTPNNPSEDLQSGSRGNASGIDDIRADTWLTAEELGMAKLEGTFNAALDVPTFISYQGGFYGIVDTDRMDSPRFAPSEGERLLFNPNYTHNVYLVEDHPDWIAIHINGMEVYEKIFEVIFEVDETTYAIAYSPIMNADYGRGDVVLETENYTVYEAVKLQGEPAPAKEYIVDILSLLQRERPNFFDGSNLEPGGDYYEQWQIALPLE